MHSKIIFNPLLKHYWWLIALCISMSLASFSAQAELTLEDYLSKEPMPGKFNLCAYDSHEFEELEQRLHEFIVGQKVEDLASYFMTMDPNDYLLNLFIDIKKENPNFDLTSKLKNLAIKPEKSRTRGINKKMHKVSGIPSGSNPYLIFHCLLRHNNVNYWFIDAHLDESNIATQIDLYLFYDEDLDFIKRNEPLDSKRFTNHTSVVKAVNRIGNIQPMPRDKFLDYMRNAGFWLHKSCELPTLRQDVFIMNIPSPEKILMKRLSHLIGLNGIGATVLSFDPISSDFIDAKVVDRLQSLECDLNEEQYLLQIEKWAVNNHPNSWFVPYIKKIVARHQLKLSNRDS